MNKKKSENNWAFMCVRCAARIEKGGCFMELEVYRRYSQMARGIEKAELARSEQIMSSQQVARRMMLDIGDKPQEHLVAIYLDTQNRIIQQKTVFIGGVRRSIAEPREILHYACHLMATSLIVVHNHPSGEAYPSRNDIDFTQKIKRSCDDLGICLLDHLIVGKSTYYSFREEREDFEI